MMLRKLGRGALRLLRDYGLTVLLPIVLAALVLLVLALSLGSGVSIRAVYGT